METLFRGKRIDGGGWVEGDKVGNNKQCFIISSFLIIHDQNGNKTIELKCSDIFQVIPESVGQLWQLSLNLKLFTGDLFTAICSPSGSISKKSRLCKVITDGRGFDVVVYYKNEWWHYSSMDFTTVEIIGNTTDNPELMEAK